jgi:hypothetical protein
MNKHDGTEPLIGLAALAKMAFDGADLSPVRKRLLDRAAHNDTDASALMDLSTVMHLMGQRECALSLQALALDLRQLYRLRNSGDPGGVRLLAFVSPGDLTENNALEFLVEGSDIHLDMLYVSLTNPLPATLPDHDLAIVAVCESDHNLPLLENIGNLVKSWPRPVLCLPDRIARLSRDSASELLRSIPGTVMPHTARIGRSALECLGPDAGLPMIVRPADSQKGQGLAKLDGPGDIPGYLETRPEPVFHVARYVDYRGKDGQFRKYRIVLIGGRPYACHMAISDRWMVHYLSAGMRDSAEKRAEEAQFFATFDDDFTHRHREALRVIAQRLELEYVGLDCGETPEGDLLIFEVDSGMTVHAMDPVEIFPYKQPQMRKVFRAFRQMLIARAS